MRGSRGRGAAIQPNKTLLPIWFFHVAVGALRVRFIFCCNDLLRGISRSAPEQVRALGHGDLGHGA